MRALTLEGDSESPNGERLEMFQGEGQIFRPARL